MAPSQHLPHRLFLVLAGSAGVLLVLLGTGLTFFSDEWAFIESPGFADPARWFTPHNEHWATLQFLVYRALLEVVGLRSYVPYHVLLIGCHLVVVCLIYVLIRRSSGPWPAAIVAAGFALFGAGFENLYWGFQIGFVGALAFGLGAFVVLDARPLDWPRAIVGALLLLASMATQGGPGVILTLAAGTELVLDPQRRTQVVTLGIPVAAYGLWYVFVGRVGVEAHQGLFSLGDLDSVLAILVSGWVTTAGAITGTGPGPGGVVIVAGAVALVVLSIRSGRVHLAPRFVGAIAAVTALYTLIGLARWFVGPDVAQYTRYTYVSAALLLVGLAAQVGRPDVRAPSARRLWLVGTAAVLTMAMVWNIRLLIAGRELFQQRAEVTRALITVALERPLPSSTDPQRSLVLVPSPAALDEITEAFGSPLSDALVPGAVPSIRPEVLAEAQRVLAEGAEIPLPGR